MKSFTLSVPLGLILFVLVYAFWPVDGCLRYFPVERAWGFGARAYPGVSMTWYGRMGAAILIASLAYPMAILLSAWEGKISSWLQRSAIHVFTLSFLYLVIHEVRHWIL